MKKVFDLTEPSVWELFFNQQRTFFSSALEQFYLNAELLRVFSAYWHGDKDKLVPVLQAEIRPCDYEGVWQELLKSHDEETAVTMLAHAGCFGLLKAVGKIKHLLDKNLYVDEICQMYVYHGWVNNEAAAMPDGISLLINNRDWHSLAVLGHADILIRHEQYDAMLRGNDQCLRSLRRHGKKELILAHLKQMSPAAVKAGEYERYIKVLDEFQDFEDLAEGDLWRLVFQVPQVSVQTRVYIALIKEQKGEDVPDELWNLIGNDQRLSDWRYSRISQFKASVLTLWLYKRLQARTAHLFCFGLGPVLGVYEGYRRHYGWFNPKKYRIDSSAWSGTYDEILQKWEGKKA